MPKGKSGKGKPKDGRKFAGGRGTGGKAVKDARGGKRASGPLGGVKVGW